jgi:hypothetical protein
MICIGLLWLSACSQAETEPCGEGVPRHSLHPYTNRTCPIAGRVGEFRLAIPRQYQFTEVAYKGFDIWKKETYSSNPKVPTLDSELDYFTVMVRRNNFKPIESYEDKKDVDRFEHNQKPTPLDQRWMWVNFQYSGKVGQERYPGKGPIRAQYGSPIENWDQYFAKSYGRLIHDKKKVWGLDHYISANPPGTGSDQKQKEFFLEDKLTRMVRCDTELQHVEPHAPLASCLFNFVIVHPQSHDVISVEASLLLQYKADVSDWSHIERGIRALFDSFVVH